LTTAGHRPKQRPTLFSVAKETIMTRSLLVALTAFAVLPALSHADEYTIDPAHSAIRFTAKHMMVTSVTGFFGKWDATINYDPKDVSKTVITATIDATTINTQVDQRDTHLKSADFFDVAKSPTVTFKSTKVSGGKGKLKVIGDLTIRGITKPVTLDVTGPSAEYKDPYGNTKVGAEATTEISRKEWGLVWNKAIEGGELVSDKIQITIPLELAKKK